MVSRSSLSVFKPANKLFDPQEARINIFGPLCKLLTIERHFREFFYGSEFLQTQISGNSRSSIYVSIP